MAAEKKSYTDSNRSLDLRLRLSRALRERFPQHFQQTGPRLFLVDVVQGMTEDSALETFLKTHPEAKENDIFIFSWITGGDMEDIYARSGSSATPVFRDPEISEMVRELESAPPVPPPSNTQDDHTVHRANIDWLIESVDSPEPLPPPMQGRILKAAQISREDMWKPRRKRY